MQLHLLSLDGFCPIAFAGLFFAVRHLLRDISSLNFPRVASLYIAFTKYPSAFSLSPRESRLSITSKIGVMYKVGRAVRPSSPDAFEVLNSSS